MFQDLDQATLDIGKVKDLLNKHFHEGNLSELANYEADTDGYSNYDQYTIAKLIEHNFIGDQFKAFHTAMKRLDKRFESNYDDILTDKTFRKNLTRIRLQLEFNMRFLGRMIMQMALKNNALERLEMALEIKLSEKVDGKDKLVFTS